MRLINAKLVPSSEGRLKIHLQYENGFAVIADPQSNQTHILDAIEQLTLDDRIELAQALEGASNAIARTRH